MNNHQNQIPFKLIGYLEVLQDKFHKVEHPNDLIGPVRDVLCAYKEWNDGHILETKENENV